VSEAQAVVVTVIGVEPTSRMGGTVTHLAIVELDVAGVVITLQGVRITRQPDGSCAVEAPRWRHPRTGHWLPCVMLPASLSGPLAAEVLSAVAGMPHRRPGARHARRHRSVGTRHIADS
jgi:stage V sporulation protein G